MERVTIGDFELTAVSDGIYHSDGGAFFGVVPKSLWKRRVEVDENNLIPAGLNSIAPLCTPSAGERDLSADGRR